MDTAHGRRGPAPAASGSAEDEISLRELYLIFKGGLAWILALSLAAGAVTFLAMHLQPVRYRATATVRLTPLQPPQAPSTSGQDPSATQNVLNLAGIAQIGFDAYRTLALSQDTLHATLAAMDTVPHGLTTANLADDLTMSKLAGGGNDPLVIAQSVTYGNPRIAADLANAWATASAAAVRTAIAGDMKHLDQTLATQLVTASDALNAAQTKWSAFQKTDDRTSLQAQLTALDGRVTGAQQRLDALERMMASTQAKQSMLRAIVQARTHGDATSLTTQVGALASAGAIAPTLAGALTRALADTPGGMAQSPQDAATVVARAQLQQQAGDLAGYVAERATIRKQLAGFAQQQSDLRARLANQQMNAEQLQRQLDSATSSYQQLASVTPVLQAAGTLAPEMASLFSRASLPEAPLGHRTVMAAVVAFVLAFFVATLGVFLRAAVVEESRAAPPPGDGPAFPDGAGGRAAAQPADGAAEGAPRALLDHRRGEGGPGEDLTATP